MKRFSGALAALTMATAFGSPALADTTLNVHYPMPGFFKDVMADISKKFMEENPGIKINFVSPRQPMRKVSRRSCVRLEPPKCRISPSPA